MSIASEITRLQNAKSCIKSAIEDKGITVGNDLKLDDYADCIGEIGGGGSGGTLAYGLCATTSIACCRNGGFSIKYSEITRQGNAMAILREHSSYNSAFPGVQVLVKKQGCDPSFYRQVGSEGSSATWCSDAWGIYAHCSNPDCYLIDRYTGASSSGSGNRWTCTMRYIRTGVNFSEECASFLYNGSRCQTGSCYGGCNCDNCNPGNDYVYLGGNFSCITSRRNRPESLRQAGMVGCSTTAYVMFC